MRNVDEEDGGDLPRLVLALYGQGRGRSPPGRTPRPAQRSRGGETLPPRDVDCRASLRIRGLRVRLARLLTGPPHRDRSPYRTLHHVSFVTSLIVLLWSGVKRE